MGPGGVYAKMFFEVPKEGVIKLAQGGGHNRGKFKVGVSPPCPRMPTTLLCPKQHPLRILVPLWRLLLEILPTDWAGGHLASAVSTYSIVTTLKRKMHCSPLFNTHGMHVTFTRLTAEQGLRLFKADRTVYIVFWGKRNRFLQKCPKLAENIVFFEKMHTHLYLKPF